MDSVPRALGRAAFAPSRGDSAGSRPAMAATGPGGAAAAAESPQCGAAGPDPALLGWRLWRRGPFVGLKDGYAELVGDSLQ